MKQKIIIAVFLLVTPLFYAGYYLSYNMWDHANYENRNFVTFTDVKQASFVEKTSTIDDFVNDTIPFKNELTAFNAACNMKLFGVIQSDKVLLGKDGWLFHKNVDDSKSIDDYQGLNHYTQEEMQTITEKLALLNTILEQKEIEFRVIIAPNKEQVYNRYMPDSIPVLDISKTSQLAQYINSNSDVKLVYPMEYFRDLSKDEHIYYKYDTHWNNLGALKGIQLILDGFENAEIVVEDKAPLMDLAYVSSIYPYVQPDEYYAVVMDGVEGKENLYLLHDSFGDMMIPILENRYDVQDATFAYFNQFNLPNNTDVFVLELNERYLYRLFTTIDTIIASAQQIEK